MDYNKSYSDLVEVRSLWRFFTTTERYVNKSFKQFEKFIQPPSNCLHKSGVARLDGFSVDLLSFSCTLGETNCLSHYPDW